MDHGRRKKRNPVRTSRIERDYHRSLTKIAEHVGTIINGFPPGDPDSDPQIGQVLGSYAESLHGWAISTARKMITEVNAQDWKMWAAHSEQIGQSLRDEIRNAPTGIAMQSLLAEQVRLIKSLPLEAAQRVHELTLKGIEDGTRANEIAKEIMRSGEVAASRAQLIARTEVSRTAATLTEARAKSIGSPGYFWRTSHDGTVRPSHKKMDGQFVPWGSPPTLDNLTGHAGCLPNCRCWPEPVIPD